MFIYITYIKPEERLAASLLKEKRLIRLFEGNFYEADDYNASLIFERPYRKLASHHRLTASRILRGIIQYKDLDKLSNETGYSKNKVKKFLSRFYWGYPLLKDWDKEKYKRIRDVLDNMEKKVIIDVNRYLPLSWNIALIHKDAITLEVPKLTEHMHIYKFCKRYFETIVWVGDYLVTLPIKIEIMETDTKVEFKI